MGYLVILKTTLVIPYPYNYLVSYLLSLKLFCRQLSLIPKTPNRASTRFPSSVTRLEMCSIKRNNTP